MTESNLAVVILAAGKGTRMKSALPKVLHKIADLPMLGHVIRTAESLAPQKIIIIAAPDQVAAFRPYAGAHEIVVQEEQFGTGHAVRCAEAALKDLTGNVLVLYGDVPLVSTNSLQTLLGKKQPHTLALLAFETKLPKGYGRIITDGNHVIKIVEEKDTDDATAKITLCNSGLMAISAPQLWAMLADLTNENSQGEYYLTDLVAASGDAVYVGMDDQGSTLNELMGVNDPNQLMDAQNFFQSRKRWEMISAGATLQCNHSIIFSYDTKIGSGASIGANVVFGPGVVVESGAAILPFSHLEGCVIKAGARVGPFARIRPGSVIGEEARVGNFVEIKNATLGKGAKANHLSYIGDADVGEHANIGAGTITCNFDGITKNKTTIGAHAFIGSNTSLVAPLSVGDGAMIAAGSVITRDVPGHALGIARGTQNNIADWARKFFQHKSDGNEAKQS